MRTEIFQNLFFTFTNKKGIKMQKAEKNKKRPLIVKNAKWKKDKVQANDRRSKRDGRTENEGLTQGNRKDELTKREGRTRT